MTEIEEAQVTRAVAVLNAAMRHRMLPEGAIPEADADKIIAAEGLVAEAQQAFNIAQEAGKARVAHYPALVDVLAEAEVFLGIGSEQHAAVVAAKAELEQGGQLPSAPAESGGGDGDGAGTEQSAPAPAAAPPEPEPDPSTGTATQEVDPQTGEVWLDHNGQQWSIIKGGSSQLEICRPGTEEKTLAPRGFLKEKISDGVADSPSPPPAPSVAAEGAAPGASSPSPEPPAPAPSADPSSGPEPSTPLTEPVDDDEGDELYRKVLDQVEEDYSPTGMPVPMDLENPPEAMPDDLTANEVANRRLHSQFNALAARARRLYTIEEAKARGCKRIFERVYLPPAMRAAREAMGKDASVTEVRSRAIEDNDVARTWLERQERHSDRAEAYKNFFEIYTEHVAVLSRDLTWSETEQRGA